MIPRTRPSLVDFRRATPRASLENDSPRLETRTRFRGLLCWASGLVFWLTTTIASAQTADWGDADLPVRDGLIGWFDARSLNDARAAEGLPRLTTGQSVETWSDASAVGHDLGQDVAHDRPIYFATEDYQAVRFLGDGQALTRWVETAAIEQATIVFVGTAFSNSGGFAGPFALSANDQNDYVSGFNLDQGPGLTTAWEVLNVEGAGFGGARDLWPDSVPFGTQTRIAVDVGVGETGVVVRVNGATTGTRPREASRLHLDRWAVGSRWYNNIGTPRLQGFFHGDITALLVYDRVLSEAEHARLDRYLADRFGENRKVAPPQATDGRVPLVTIADPPRIQVFEPGFTIRQLPVELTNINNLVYRDDGRLMALGYDGRLWWLDDTDADGLEDRATLYFDGRDTFRGPIGLALAPQGFRHGFGAFVPSKGKVSFVVDVDGDDVADEERVIATGWQEISQAVDALGVDIDPRDGSIWFGLGTGDYTNAYRVDGAGQAHYDLGSDRGTIQRIAPDFESREIVATGIRFPVGLRFSPNGEPFVTDQEGATWLANGNPFDELLHIRPGKHYGFPPRHPDYLPNVIDEPSTFDFGPQHQSTCGLNFNVPVLAGGPTFGPKRWEDNLFVAGYSRGKLYRTQLCRTEVGYVAASSLLASSDHLLVDAVVTPRGGLLVALHSGGPDWGSGPNGAGELWLIEAEEQVPRPVASWAQSPTEIRVAFDQPLAAESIPSAEEITVEYGSAVAAGDRFEVLRPGYQVVADQLRQPRFAQPVTGVQVTPDLRTLILHVEPLDTRLPRALTLPGLGRPMRTEAGPITQLAVTDLLVETHGVQVAWSDATGEMKWQGWLPHLDTTVSDQLSWGIAENEKLRDLCDEPGKLSFETQIDLRDLLRPEVQPGSEIAYEWPAERATVRLRLPIGTSVDFKVGEWFVLPDAGADDRYLVIEGTIDAREATEIPIRLSMATGPRRMLDLQVSWWTSEDDTPRPFPVRRFWLPWTNSADASQESSEDPDTVIHPLAEGGNWERGRRLFFSESLGCAKCHRYEARGGRIGPDLTNLPHRDVDSIVRDIRTPSFAINPDYLTQAIATEDGGQHVGVVRTDGDHWLIGTQDGKTIAIDASDIVSVQPMPLSTMPDDLFTKLQAESPTALADLLVYLRTPGPHMPVYAPLPMPAARTVAEMDALSAGGAANNSERAIKILLVDGEKDHGQGEHDYPAWREMWASWLRQAENVEVDVARDWPTARQWAWADTVVLFQRGDWTNERAADVDRHFGRGGGLVLIHWAVDGRNNADEFARRIGLAADGGTIRYRHGPLRLDFGPGSAHPIGRNLGQVDFYDESYWLLAGDRARLQVLAEGVEEDEPRPLFWTLEPAGGRVFVSILGHYMWTFDDPVYRTIMLRGLAWSAGEQVDRFEAIVESGARLVDEEPVKAVGQ